MKIDLRKRQQNAETGVFHISTKGWEDSVSAQINIESQIDDLDVDETIKTHLKSKLNFDGMPEDETEALDALRSMTASINSEIDKFNSGQVLSVTKSGSKFVSPQDLGEGIKSKSEELERMKAELEDEKTSEERKKELQEKYDQEQSERDKMYEEMSGAVSTVASSMVSTGSKLLSGDGQAAIDATLNILIGIGSFLTKGLMAAVHGIKSLHESRKLNKGKDELDKQEQRMKELQAELDEIAAGNHDAGMEPATPEEVEEIKSQAVQEDFEEVGEIETWDDAFKYGYAKLKQIHGLNYDEIKAKETLEGLKAKYPDNPKVVIGALKYGGRKKKDENQQNSRIDLRKRSINSEVTKDLCAIVKTHGTPWGILARSDKAYGISDKLSDSDWKSAIKKKFEVYSFFDSWDEAEEVMKDLEPEQSNSRIDLRRTKNAKPQLKKVYKSFTDSDPAYKWIMDEVGPMEDPIASIKIDGKVGDLRWDEEGESLVLYCWNLPKHKEVINDSEWEGQLGQMFDYINQQISKYGD